MVQGLVARGYRVRVVDRFPNGRSLNLNQIHNEIEMVTVDLFDPEQLDKSILQGVSYLFHFATPSTPASSLLDAVAEFQRHLIPTMRLFQAAREIGVLRILFPSSGGTVYGSQPKYPATEDSPLEPTTSYSAVKVALEKFLGLLRQQGTDSIVYRIGNAYGPHQRGWISQQGVVSVLLRAALLDEVVPVVAAGNTVRDYIFVEDVIDAILCSFNRPHRFHVYNVGSGKGTSLRTVVGLVEKVTGRRLRTISQEKRLGETTRIVLNSRRICREFGWRPKTSLLQGIRKTWRWIQATAPEKFVRR